MRSAIDGHPSCKINRCNLLTAITLLAYGCDTEDPEAIRLAELQETLPGPTYQASPGTPDRTEELELIFCARTEETDAGEILTSEVAGELTLDQKDRIARPYRYVDESHLYIEEVWSRGDDSGVTERGCRVWRQINPNPLPTLDTSGAPTVNQNVADAVASMAPTETLQLDLKLRNFPEWNIPLAPDGLGLSPADIQEGLTRRAVALEERQAAFSSMAAATETQVVGLQGRVIARFWKPGWLSVEIPAAGFSELAANPELERIDGPYGKESGPGWDLGDGRQGAFLDADQFLATGYDGEEPNSARHGYNDIVIGMTESGGYEDGACAFRDTYGCTSNTRIIETYRCDNLDGDSNFCEVGTVDTNDGSEQHGTLVTSVAIGDYTDGQGNGLALGDSAWVQETCSSSADCGNQPCENLKCAHSSAWETARTGMAPEARAVLFGRANSSNVSASFTDMFDDAIDLSLDITSAS